MKTLSFIVFFSCFAVLGCNNDPAAKLSSIELAEAKTETPKKKIAEQFSSPDNVKVTEKEVIIEKADSENTVGKNNSEVEPLETESTKKTVLPKKPIATNNKEEPKFVKTVSKPVAAPVKRTAEIEFDEYTYDFGEIMQGDKIKHNFTFKNTGRAPLTITKADATCGCATPSIPFMDIMPGEDGYIGIMYNSVGKEGEETPQVTIYSNAGKQPILVLKMKGYVKTPDEAKEEIAVKDSMIYVEKDSIKTEGHR